MPKMIYDYVRVRGADDLVFFSLEYPMLYCDPPSRIFAGGLRFARKRFPTHMCMRQCLDVTEIRSNRASSSVSLTKSLLKKTQGPRLATCTALNLFIMSFHDV